MPHAHTVSDLAKQGPLGRTTLWSLIGEGKLPARKIGGKVIVLDADWRAFLESAPSARSSNLVSDGPIASMVRSFDASIKGLNAGADMIAAVGRLGK